MKKNKFCILIDKINKKIFLDDNELFEDVIITESIVQDTKYKVEINDDKFVFYNSEFGFNKVYYQDFLNKLIITNDINLLDIKRFDPKGISSILMFGYVLPNTSLYDGILALPPRTKLHIDLGNYTYDVSYERLPNTNNLESNVNDIKNILTLKNDEQNAYLMSGGRDSRVIACLNKSKLKKTFTFKLNGFLPDEMDNHQVDSYKNDIKGTNFKCFLDSNDDEVINSYKISTEESFDHVHAGRWKFDYFIKKITRNNSNKYKFVNGQTADTIISLNLTGDNFSSRIRRASFYGGIEHTLIKNCLKLASGIFSKINNKYTPYFKGIVNCNSHSEYYSGYLVNNIEFPGVEVKKKQFFYSILGENLTNSVYKKINELIETKNNLYTSDEKHLMMLDVCLNTFIWGMDMRGLREACHRYGHETNFIFMKDTVISKILSLPKSYTSPLSDYKKVLKDIEKEFINEIYENPIKEFKTTLDMQTSFESIILSGVLGEYWRGVVKTDEFIEFVDYVFNEYEISIGDISVTVDNYSYIDRVISLFFWYKKYIV
ncbi:hypothetical protein [Aliivibrio fischeri]|uniref:hypothetical protein n=1 Tax=Aliivibrio fischeri TaxID=668 RepID=UPI00105F3DF7|nr:hypothetical protein [Aliivibrio fischeri]TDM56047.1 hypothetical protein VFFQA001_01010 [Aliivibrio fischeri]